MKEIKISNPATVDEYKENLQTLLLLAESKKNAGLAMALKDISKAFENECKIVGELITYLQHLEETIQDQYSWMVEHGDKEELCSELYVDKIMIILCIRQKINTLNEILDSIVTWEQSYCVPKLFPNVARDN